jgi:polysaccharide transporter, PST family
MSAVVEDDPVEGNSGMGPVVDDDPVVTAVARPVWGDTLGASIVLMLVMTVVQRLIGFGRGILFCRWLSPEQLGEWDVAFGFLNLAAPLAVFGLPGAFGRYVEFYRQRGQLHTFLKRTICVCALTGAAASVIVAVCRDWFSRLIFGSDAESRIVVWVAACLAALIAHNFLASLLIAVRRYRMVSALQFVQSMGFAVLSIALLAFLPADATSVVVAFGAATVISIAVAITWLREVISDKANGRPRLDHFALWTKLLPFAVWVWVTNLLANLFDVIDRYMIVHHSGMDVDEALRQVGYYHSSRIIPLLLAGVAGLLGAMITPHLSHDWELRRHDAVVRRLNMVLKFTLAALLTASIVTLLGAPLLFNVAFQHKFEGGFAVLPWTLAYCAWFGGIAVAQNYLWCIERPGWSSSALFVGLLINVGLNLVLLPRYGLEGAVWATTAANFAALLLVLLVSQWQGMHVDLGVWILVLAIGSLGLGPWFALAVLVGVAALAATTDRVLLPTEKQQLLRVAMHPMEKLGGLRQKMIGPTVDLGS